MDEREIESHLKNVSIRLMRLEEHLVTMQYLLAALYYQGSKEQSNAEKQF